MTIKTFITKAIEGGWKPRQVECTHKLMADENGCPFGEHYPLIHEILLDKKSWQAVGKVEMWKSQDMFCKKPYWHIVWLRMIDTLAEGKSIEDYLKTL